MLLEFFFYQRFIIALYTAYNGSKMIKLAIKKLKHVIVLKGSNRKVCNSKILISLTFIKFLFNCLKYFKIRFKN